MEDNTASDNELDSVTWESPYWPNLTSVVGYGYELQNKGFNNNYGSNWQTSCNVYGSPGSEPITDCSGTCTISLCAAGGASTDNVDVDGDECDCDNAIHYSPSDCSCNLSFVFCFCAKCHSTNAKNNKNKKIIK